MWPTRSASLHSFFSLETLGDFTTGGRPGCVFVFTFSSAEGLDGAYLEPVAYASPASTLGVVSASACASSGSESGCSPSLSTDTWRDFVAQCAGCRSGEIELCPAPLRPSARIPKRICPALVYYFTEGDLLATKQEGRIFAGDLQRLVGDVLLGVGDRRVQR